MSDGFEALAQHKRQIGWECPACRKMSLRIVEDVSKRTIYFGCVGQWSCGYVSQGSIRATEQPSTLASSML